MGGTHKTFVEKLSIEAVAHAHDDYRNKAVWACTVCLILFDNPNIDAANIVFDNFLD